MQTLKEKRQELKQELDELTDKEIRIIYALLLSITTGNIQNVEAMEKAKTENDMESVEKIAEKILLERGM